VANEPPFSHHGLFTTLRQSVLAQAGEGHAARQAFQMLPDPGRHSHPPRITAVWSTCHDGRSLDVSDHRGTNPETSLVIMRSISVHMTLGHTTWHALCACLPCLFSSA
jgi:hypothetical protein